MPNRRLRAAAFAIACVIAIPSADARPRDPFSGLVASIGKAFQPMKVKRHAAAKRTAIARKAKAHKVSVAAAKPHPTAVSPVGHPDLDRYADAPRVRRGGTPNASWYGTTGNPTANGEHYDQMGPTCAHRRMKFGTLIRVTNLWNGKTATCRINDRGPYITGRVLDVSKGIAAQLGMLTSGVARVSIGVID